MSQDSNKESSDGDNGSEDDNVGEEEEEEEKERKEGEEEEVASEQDEMEKKKDENVMQHQQQAKIGSALERRLTQAFLYSEDHHTPLLLPPIPNPFIFQRPRVKDPEMLPLSTCRFLPPKPSFMTGMFFMVNSMIGLIGLACVAMGLWFLFDPVALGVLLLENDQTIALREGLSKRHASILCLTFIGLGCVFGFMGGFGMSGCLQSHAYSLVVFTRLMVLLLAAQFVGIILIALFRDYIIDAFFAEIKETMKTHYDGKLKSKKLFSMLLDLYMVYVSCCGADSWKDFSLTPWFLDVNQVRLKQVNGSTGLATTSPTDNGTEDVDYDPLDNQPWPPVVSVPTPDLQAMQQEKERYEKIREALLTTNAPLDYVMMRREAVDVKSVDEIERTYYDRDDYHLVCSFMGPRDKLWWFPLSCCKTKQMDPDDKKVTQLDGDCLCKKASATNRYTDLSCNIATKNLLRDNVFLILGLLLTFVGMEMTALFNAIELVAQIQQEEKHEILQQAQQLQMKENLAQGLIPDLFVQLGDSLETTAVLDNQLPPTEGSSVSVSLSENAPASDTSSKGVAAPDPLLKGVTASDPPLNGVAAPDPPLKGVATADSRLNGGATPDPRLNGVAAPDTSFERSEGP